MRYGLPLSIFFHGLLLTVVLIGWPSFSKPLTEKIVDVPVAIVVFDEQAASPGRRQDHTDDRKPDDEDTKAKKISRPDKPPEPREAEVKKPSETPDKAPVTPKTEPRAETPKAPAAPPDTAKPEVKKPSETPADAATPRAEREAAAPSRPTAPPAPKNVPVPQPKSTEKVPATPDTEPKPNEIKKPPAPPEPERDQAALRPPPRITTPEPSKAPERPDADRDAAAPQRPTSPPKPQERPSALLRPPSSPEGKTEEPKQEKPQITSRPSEPPRAQPEKTEEGDKPQITGRPSEPPSPRESKPNQSAHPSTKPDAVQRSPDRARKAPQSAEVERTARDQRVGAATTGKITRSERDAVARKIRACWNVDPAAKDLASLIVVIEVSMNRDGTVREAVVSDETRGLRNPTVRAFADSARRALLNPRCQPLPLPREKYEEWKTFKAEFDPSDS
ncbi:MAG: hypothetical protein ACREIP_01890 [Alphaproteobacteria bacterium]